MALVAVAKNPLQNPVQEMQETWVQSLSGEGPLEEERATHSIFLTGNFHGQGSLVGYSPRGRKDLDTPVCVHGCTSTYMVDLHCCVSFRYTAQ